MELSWSEFHEYEVMGSCHVNNSHLITAERQREREKRDRKRFQKCVLHKQYSVADKAKMLLFVNV